MADGEQRPEHRVGAVPVRPQLEGAGQRAGAVGYAGQQRRRIAPAPRRHGPPARPSRPRTSRPAPASRSRRAPRRRAGPSRAPTTAAPAGAGPARPGPTGWRRQRASGRRRSAPRPVHGASTSTRSNDPGGHGGRVPSAVTTPSTPSAAPRACARTRPARCGCRSLATTPRAAFGRERREQGGLAARSGAQVEPAQVGPVERRRGQREGDQLRTLVLHARPPLGDGRDRARVAGRQVHAVRRPARRLARQLLARRPAGPGHQGDAGRFVVGGQQRLEPRASPTASRESSSTTHRGWAWATREVAEPGRRRRRARPGRPRRRGRAPRPAAAPRWRSRPAPGPTSERTSGDRGADRGVRRAPASPAAGGCPAAARRAPAPAPWPAAGRRRRRARRRTGPGGVPSPTSARSRTPRRGRSARAAAGPRAGRGWCRRRPPGRRGAPPARRCGPRQPRCSLTSRFGALVAQASVMISSSS